MPKLSDREVQKVRAAALEAGLFTQQQRAGLFEMIGHSRMSDSLHATLSVLL